MSGSSHRDIIRAAMAEAGVSSAEVARRAGRGEAHVSKVLSGRTPDPRWSTLEAIAGALGRRWVLEPVGAPPGRPAQDAPEQQAGEEAALEEARWVDREE